jgi:hypothetical protein
LEKCDIRDAALAILGYFVRNPEAADDLEGIARWRLVDEIVYLKVEETDRALKWLVGEGLLIESSIPGNGRAFSLNTAKLDAAQRLLRAGTADT